MLKTFIDICGNMYNSLFSNSSSKLTTTDIYANYTNVIKKLEVVEDLVLCEHYGAFCTPFKIDMRLCELNNYAEIEFINNGNFTGVYLIKKNNMRTIMKVLHGVVFYKDYKSDIVHSLDIGSWKTFYKKIKIRQLP